MRSESATCSSRLYSLENSFGVKEAFGIFDSLRGLGRGKQTTIFEAARQFQYL